VLFLFLICFIINENIDFLYFLGSILPVWAAIKENYFGVFSPFLETIRKSWWLEVIELLSLFFGFRITKLKIFMYVGTYKVQRYNRKGLLQSHFIQLTLLLLLCSTVRVFCFCYITSMLLGFFFFLWFHLEYRKELLEIVIILWCITGFC